MNMGLRLSAWFFRAEDEADYKYFIILCIYKRHASEYKYWTGITALFHVNKHSFLVKLPTIMWFELQNRLIACLNKVWLKQVNHNHLEILIFTIIYKYYVTTRATTNARIACFSSLFVQLLQGLCQLDKDVNDKVSMKLWRFHKWLHRLCQLILWCHEAMYAVKRFTAFTNCSYLLKSC